MLSVRDLGIGATINVDDVPLSQKYLVAVLLGVAIWNAIEMLPIIYFTFTRYAGLYFWSMLIADLAVLVYATGFVLNNFQLTGNQTLPTVLTCSAWIPMVTAQSLVLYSRLHLINMSNTVRLLALSMIIVNGVTLHTSTAITTIGSNSKLAHRFLEPYAIMERIQVTGFFVQELILSGLYVYKARAFLGWRGGRKSRTKAHQKLRLMMTHLIVSNVIVVALDITILILEFMGLYFIQVSYKAFVYAVKLKCEVGILNRLVDFVKSASASGAGAGGANGGGLDNDDDHRCDHHGRFQNFHSFQLSSQAEREWETTLRNTFGVALVDEEEKEATAAAANHHRQQQQQQQQQGGSSRTSLAIAVPLPPSPDVALVAGEKEAGSSGGGSGGSSSSKKKKKRKTAGETRRKKNNSYRQVPEPTLMDTFGGGQRSRSRNSTDSPNESPGSDGAPQPDRGPSFDSSGADTAAVVEWAAGSRPSSSSPSLRRPGGGPRMEGPRGSGLSLGSVRAR